MRFHSLFDNTDHYLCGSNNHPYGAPDPLPDDDLPYKEETVKATPVENRFFQGSVQASTKCVTITVR